MRISRKNANSILLLTTELIPIFVLGIMPTNQSINCTMVQIGITALLCLVISTLAVYKVCKGMHAFLYFVIFAYLFSFGQCIMSILGLELRNSAFAISRGFFKNEAIKHSSLFCLLSIQVTCIGFLLYYATSNNNRVVEEANRKYYSRREEKARIIGWLMLLIGIVPTFINLYHEYQLMLTRGYSFTLQTATGTTRILGLIAGFFTSGILLLFCFEKKRRKLLYAIIIAYIGLQIAGGSRIQVFRLGIMFLLIEDLYFKSMNRRKWLMVLAVGLVAALGLSLLSSVRNYIYLSDDIGQLLRTSLENLWKNNFIAATINEMGNTQAINTLVLDSCPGQIPFQFGLSFIKMLWAIIPNFIGDAYTGYIGVDITFSPLYTVTNSGMGASYISEGYWNFGYFSLLYFILFGALFGVLSKVFDKMCKQRSIDPGKFFLTVYAIYYALFLVRSEALGFGRSFVYYALLPYLLICTSTGPYRRKTDNRGSLCE